MIDWKLKLNIIFLITTLIGSYFTYRFFTIPIQEPQIVEKIVYQDREVAKDVIVEKPVPVIKEKIVTRTITEKGTCEETQIEKYEVGNSKETTSESSKERLEEKIESKTSIPSSKYSLGLNLEVDKNWNYNYEIELGYQIYQNLEINGSVELNKDFNFSGVGIGLELKF